MVPAGSARRRTHKASGLRGSGLADRRDRGRGGRCRGGAARAAALGHLDGAVQDGPFLDDEPRCTDVAIDGARGLHLDLLRGADVSAHLPDHDHALGVDVGAHVAVVAHGELVVGQGDLALDLALDDEVLIAQLQLQEQIL